MTRLNAELYDALIAIKVPEDKARAAAATIPASDQVVTKTVLDGLKEAMAELSAEMRMIKWILGFLTAAITGLIIATVIQ